VTIKNGRLNHERGKSGNFLATKKGVDNKTI